MGMVYTNIYTFFEAYKKERSEVVFAIELNLLPCVLHSKIKGRCPPDGGVNLYY
jgi:hypothetical protein